MTTFGHHIEKRLKSALNDDFCVVSTFMGLHIDIIGYTVPTQLKDENGETDLSHFIGINKHSLGTGIITFSHHDQNAKDHVVSVLQQYDVKPRNTQDNLGIIVESLNRGTLNVILDAWADYQNDEMYLDTAPVSAPSTSAGFNAMKDLLAAGCFPNFAD